MFNEGYTPSPEELSKDSSTSGEQQEMLSPEAKADILAKVQDINADGVAFSVINGDWGPASTDDESETLKSVLSRGLLAFNQGQSQTEGEEDDSLWSGYEDEYGDTADPENWPARIRSRGRKAHVFFNIVGRSNFDDTKPHDSRMAKTEWFEYGSEAYNDSIVAVIFNTASFVEDDITNPDESVISPTNKYIQPHWQKVNHFNQDLSRRDIDQLKEYRYLSALPDDHPERVRAKNYLDRANREIKDKPSGGGIHLPINRDTGLPMVFSAYGFRLYPRVAPRFFTGLVIKVKEPLETPLLGKYMDKYSRDDWREIRDEFVASLSLEERTEFEREEMLEMMEHWFGNLDHAVTTDRARRIASVMLEVNKDHPERLMPIYSLNGDLLWPEFRAASEIIAAQQAVHGQAGSNEDIPANDNGNLQ